MHLALISILGEAWTSSFFSVNSVSNRVELAIAEALLKVHSCVLMAEEGVNPEDSKVPLFITEMEGKTFTFQGRNDGDDADMADGGPVPVRVETGEGSSDADKNTDAKPADASAKKRTHSSTKMAKKNLSHLTSEQTAGDLSMAGRSSLDVAAIRLVDVPEKARKLLNLLEQSKDPRFHALPLASKRVAAFADTVNELVYDILISKVRQRLGEVSHLPIWSSVEEQTAFALPNFSSYPQDYVTSVGEYLLTLPQQMEPLAEGISTNGDSNNEDSQFFATEWMFKVAEGATALYMEQLRGIQYISDRGAQQLCVDIEYLSNVLAALSMPIPPVLATFQTCLATPRDELKDVMKSDAGSELDFPTANLVCKTRRISFD
ncbi:hypothetical protein HID58_038012 [Brassica napus]|uniref:Conserved oligomeric Golgi complex subunit 7 n=3 Tax=Brassica napus TaxID=3708 RepID=A0ABQ8BMY5_BRANA|nr:hypothetical protein HID58_038012 [Brassica napus]